MYLILLVGMIIIQLMIKLRQGAIKDAVFGKKVIVQTGKKEWLWIRIQLLLIMILCSLKALNGHDLSEAILLFLISFVFYYYFIRILTSLLNWLEDYLNEMPSELIFSFLIPVIILICFNELDTRVEYRFSIMALAVSLLMVYGELLKMIIKLTQSEEKGSMEKLIKVKSIVVWLIMILLNLYTLLVVIQFTFNGTVRHFIPATSFDRESGVDLFYYLIVTFTTVGFGDICPQTTLAKLVTVVISMSGMLFTGIFVGIILSVEEK